MLRLALALSMAAACSGLRTVYFVRHAQSMENVRVAAFKSAAAAVKRRTAPGEEDREHVRELLKFDPDAPLSTQGWAQAESLAEELREVDFFRKRSVDLVVHSPLQRTRDTLFASLDASFPGSYHVPTGKVHAAQGRTEGPIPVVVAPDLRERRPREYLPLAFTWVFKRRVERFRGWLLGLEEDVVVVVGHGQLFKHLLGSEHEINNCDVVEVQVTPAGFGEVKGVRQSVLIPEHSDR